MRHLKRGRKLGRNPAQRKALFRSLARAIIKEDRIKTTLPKAKELRTIIEPLITWAKKFDHWVVVEQKKVNAALKGVNAQLSAIERLIEDTKSGDWTKLYLEVQASGEEGKTKKDRAIVRDVERAGLKGKVEELNQLDKLDHKEKLVRIRRALAEERKTVLKARSQKLEAELEKFSDEEKERYEKGVSRNVQVVRELKKRLGGRCNQNIFPYAEKDDSERKSTVEFKGDFKREKSGERVSGTKYEFSKLVDEQDRPLTYPAIIWILIHEIAPRFEKRNGGYTRIYRLAKKRQGDNAEMCIMEFVEAGEPVKKEKKTAVAPKAPKAPKVTAKKADAEVKEEPKAQEEPAVEEKAEPKAEEKPEEKKEE